ncbi:MAG: hypothetical protein KatS3mg105_0285 [Gemmatales bacterium]|nr:MAG: hypothetical protein KatS3mg105_0285 [Gemmatales bacterium]
MAFDDDAPIPLAGDDFLEDQPKKRTTDKKLTPEEEELFDFELSTDGSIDIDMGADDLQEDYPPITSSGIGSGPKAPLTDDEVFGDADANVFDNDDFQLKKTSLPQQRGKTGVAAGGGKRTTGRAPDDDIDLDEDAGTGSSIISLGDEFAADDDEDINEDQAPASGNLNELAPTEDIRLEDISEDPSDETQALSDDDDLFEEFDRPSGESPFELDENDLDEPAGLAPPPEDDDDDEVSLGELTPGGDFASGASGINLHSPADTGVNLDSGPISGVGGDDEIEFELSLDADATPAPAHSEADSSEFELTLDDDGELAIGGESSGDDIEGGDKDIFETDFDIPALDEESGSEVAALDDDEIDTDLESSDFEFSGEDIESADESESQVVAIDDDEVIAGEVEEDEEIDELVSIEEEVDEDQVAAAALPPASWGVLPTIFMLPCTVIMFLLSLMTFELMHNMWGYRQPNPTTGIVVRPISEMFGAELPD